MPHTTTADSTCAGEDLPPLADRLKNWREAEPGETLEHNDPQSSGRKREYPQEQEDSGVTKPCKNKWRRLNTLLSTSAKLLGLHNILTVSRIRMELPPPLVQRIVELLDDCARFWTSLLNSSKSWYVL